MLIVGVGGDMGHEVMGYYTRIIICAHHLKYII